MGGGAQDERHPRDGATAAQPADKPRRAGRAWQRTGSSRPGKGGRGTAATWAHPATARRAPVLLASSCPTAAHRELSPSPVQVVLEVAEAAPHMRGETAAPRCVCMCVQPLCVHGPEHCVRRADRACGWHEPAWLQLAGWAAPPSTPHTRVCTPFTRTPTHPPTHPHFAPPPFPNTQLQASGARKRGQGASAPLHRARGPSGGADRGGHICAARMTGAGTAPRAVAFSPFSRCLLLLPALITSHHPNPSLGHASPPEMLPGVSFAPTGASRAPSSQEKARELYA